MVVSYSVPEQEDDDTIGEKDPAEGDQEGDPEGDPNIRIEMQMNQMYSEEDNRPFDVVQGEADRETGVVASRVQSLDDAAVGHRGTGKGGGNGVRSVLNRHRSRKSGDSNNNNNNNTNSSVLLEEESDPLYRHSTNEHRYGRSRKTRTRTPTNEVGELPALSLKTNQNHTNNDNHDNTNTTTNIDTDIFYNGEEVVDASAEDVDVNMNMNMNDTTLLTTNGVTGGWYGESKAAPARPLSSPPPFTTTSNTIANTGVTGGLYGEPRVRPLSPPSRAGLDHPEVWKKNTEEDLDEEEEDDDEEDDGVSGLTPHSPGRSLTNREKSHSNSNNNMPMDERKEWENDMKVLGLCDYNTTTTEVGEASRGVPDFCEASLNALNDMCYGGDAQHMVDHERTLRQEPDMVAAATTDLQLDIDTGDETMRQDRTTADVQATTNLFGRTSRSPTNLLGRTPSTPALKRILNLKLSDKHAATHNDQEEHTAIEVEYVEPNYRGGRSSSSKKKTEEEEGTGTDTGTVETVDTVTSPKRKKKNALLKAMARHAKDDFKFGKKNKNKNKNKGGVGDDDGENDNDTYDESMDPSLGVISTGALHDNNNNVYATFTGYEKRQFLQLINTGMSPFDATGQVMKQREGMDGAPNEGPEGSIADSSFNSEYLHTPGTHTNTVLSDNENGSVASHRSAKSGASTHTKRRSAKKLAFWKKLGTKKVSHSSNSNTIKGSRRLAGISAPLQYPASPLPPPHQQQQSSTPTTPISPLYSPSVNDDNDNDNNDDSRQQEQQHRNFVDNNRNHSNDNSDSEEESDDDNSYNHERDRPSLMHDDYEEEDDNRDDLIYEDGDTYDDTYEEEENNDNDNNNNNSNTFAKSGISYYDAIQKKDSDEEDGNNNGTHDLDSSGILGIGKGGEGSTRSRRMRKLKIPFRGEFQKALSKRGARTSSIRVEDDPTTTITAANEDNDNDNNNDNNDHDNNDHDKYAHQEEEEKEMERIVAIRSSDAPDSSSSSSSSNSNSNPIIPVQQLLSLRQDAMEEMEEKKEEEKEEDEGQPQQQQQQKSLLPPIMKRDVNYLYSNDDEDDNDDSDNDNDNYEDNELVGMDVEQVVVGDGTTTPRSFENEEEEEEDDHHYQHRHKSFVVDPASSSSPTQISPSSVVDEPSMQLQQAFSKESLLDDTVEDGAESDGYEKAKDSLVIEHDLSSELLGLPTLHSTKTNEEEEEDTNVEMNEHEEEDRQAQVYQQYQQQKSMVDLNMDTYFHSTESMTSRAVAYNDDADNGGGGGETVAANSTKSSTNNKSFDAGSSVMSGKSYKTSHTTMSTRSTRSRRQGQAKVRLAAIKSQQEQQNTTNNGNNNDATNMSVLSTGTGVTTSGGMSRRNKASGWQESIEAVAAAQGKKWDPDHGWKDYVDPALIIKGETPLDTSTFYDQGDRLPEMPVSMPVPLSRQFHEEQPPRGDEQHQTAPQKNIPAVTTRGIADDGGESLNAFMNDNETTTGGEDETVRSYDDGVAAGIAIALSVAIAAAPATATTAVEEQSVVTNRTNRSTGSGLNSSRRRRKAVAASKMAAARKISHQHSQDEEDGDGGDTHRGGWAATMKAASAKLNMEGKHWDLAHGWMGLTEQEKKEMMLHSEEEGEQQQPQPQDPRRQAGQGQSLEHQRSQSLNDYDAIAVTAESDMQDFGTLPKEDQHHREDAAIAPTAESDRQDFGMIPKEEHHRDDTIALTADSDMQDFGMIPNSTTTMTTASTMLLSADPTSKEDVVQKGRPGAGAVTAAAATVGGAVAAAVATLAALSTSPSRTTPRSSPVVVSPKRYAKQLDDDERSADVDQLDQIANNLDRSSFQFLSSEEDEPPVVVVNDDGNENKHDDDRMITYNQMEEKEEQEMNMFTTNEEEDANVDTTEHKSVAKYVQLADTGLVQSHYRVSKNKRLQQLEQKQQLTLLSSPPEEEDNNELEAPKSIVDSTATTAVSPGGGGGNTQQDLARQLMVNVQKQTLDQDDADLFPSEESTTGTNDHQSRGGRRSEGPVDLDEIYEQEVEYAPFRSTFPTNESVVSGKNSNEVYQKIYEQGSHESFDTGTDFSWDDADEAAAPDTTSPALDGSRSTGTTKNRKPVPTLKFNIRDSSSVSSPKPRRLARPRDGIVIGTSPVAARATAKAPGEASFDSTSTASKKSIFRIAGPRNDTSPIRHAKYHPYKDQIIPATNNAEQDQVRDDKPITPPVQDDGPTTMPPIRDEEVPPHPEQDEKIMHSVHTEKKGTSDVNVSGDVGHSFYTAKSKSSDRTNVVDNRAAAVVRCVDTITPQASSNPSLKLPPKVSALHTFWEKRTTSWDGECDVVHPSEDVVPPSTVRSELSTPQDTILPPLESQHSEWKSFLVKKVKAESAAAAAVTASYQQNDEEEKDTVFDFPGGSEGNFPKSSVATRASPQQKQRTTTSKPGEPLDVHSAFDEISELSPIRPDESDSEYSNAKTVSEASTALVQGNTFLQRIQACAAVPLDNNIFQRNTVCTSAGGPIAAHLGFLRNNPNVTSSSAESINENNTRQSQILHATSRLCGRPENVIVETDEEATQAESTTSQSTTMERKLKKSRSRSTSRPRQNNNDDLSSVISDGFGAKSAYLEAIARRAAVSSVSSKKKKKRRSPGSEVSAATNTSSTKQSEKFQHFLERRASKDHGENNNRQSPPPSKEEQQQPQPIPNKKPLNSRAEVTSRAERYASEKVDEMMDVMAGRTEHQKGRATEEYEETGAFPTVAGRPTALPAHHNDAARIAAEELAAARVEVMMQRLSTRNLEEEEAEI